MVIVIAFEDEFISPGRINYFWRKKWSEIILK